MDIFSSLTQFRIKLSLTIKKLKTLLMTLFFILIFSHSVFGFVNSKQVMEYFHGGKLATICKDIH